QPKCAALEVTCTEQHIHHKILWSVREIAIQTRWKPSLRLCLRWVEAAPPPLPSSMETCFS
ncbi:unnamed protein product, partial [Urochloa humidicola]